MPKEVKKKSAQPAPAFADGQEVNVPGNAGMIGKVVGTTYDPKTGYSYQVQFSAKQAFSESQLTKSQ